MKLHVLGSAAGGGFPQWNCNCRNCSGLRAGTLRARARTQSSVAIGEGDDWVLVNASPDILAQLRAAPFLQPARALRDTGIRAVMLVDAQIDHTTGLLMLREGRPLPLWTTRQVREDLSSGNPLLSVLEHYCGSRWHCIEPDGRPFEVDGLPGLEWRAVALSSAAPPYSPHRHAPEPGDNIGLFVSSRASGRSLFYAPGLGEIEPQVDALMQRADVILVDGTFWSDDEMIALGVSSKRAREIGHLPQSGPGGMIEALSRYPRARRILIHVNNTNPILDEDSDERLRLDAEGIEVAHDGLSIEF
ncbi:pyrroloquinoline quinone biosynthesis protein PqqB [Caldimonas tepidiphila]|uniref:pyrroloquinoline quinone biosynthesis protein PqqB n=1 Tax=Caldimonas tepidiphila TaxID=2315841 RepID=UPI000E5B94BB|nr:pyrroloquinoline quinone biosynthesis protein PqqB [Caldimonas tepidiphila]